MKDIIYKNNRPLKIVHSYYNDDSLTLDEKKAKVTETIEKLRDLEFGGVVTNVRWNQKSDPNVIESARSGYYTKDSEEWEVFRFALSEIDRLGLRAWIYDEHGYPSGGAGGLTLAAHPEYECRAIAKITEVILPGETKTIALPNAHNCFLYGALYPCSDDGIPSSFTPTEEFFEGATTLSELTFKNDTDEKMLAVAFAEKYLYEGTHAEHNTYECRRYIDVMNTDAVREYIKNTYEAYTAHAKDHYIDGDGLVEAYFTDEPSLMGCYINWGLYPKTVRDEYDDSVPLYPIVNYGRDVKNTFESLSGLPFEPNIIYLFYGDDEKAKKVRYFFHKTTSDLFERSFYAQISNYCRENNTRFSGHILLEDDIRYHVIFEGNYFSFLRHMHIPGIDMLHSLPEKVRQFIFTPKLISSIAHAYDRPHVMSEVSAHSQGGKVTPEQMYASIALQYVFGVDIFTSYYNLDLCDRPTYQKYNRAIGNIGDIMGGGSHVADVLLYYPIETFMINHKTPDAHAFTTYTEPENTCRDGFVGIMDQLCDRQIDFDLADFEVLKNLEIRNGKLIGRQGEIYSYLVLPPMELTPETQAYFSYLESRGIIIYFLHGKCFDTLNVASFGRKFDSAEALVSAFDRKANDFAIELDSAHVGVACLCRSFDGKHKYIFTNSQNRDIKISLTLKKLENKRLFSPVDMLERPCNFGTDSDIDTAGGGAEMTGRGAETKDGRTRLDFTLGAYETLIVD